MPRKLFSAVRRVLRVVGRNIAVIGFVSLAAAGVVYTLVEGNEPLLGLDLQGGASVVLEPTRAADQEELDVAVEIIRNRVDGLGVAEPEISTQGDNILVQLPGVDDQKRAIELVGQTAELRFRPVLEVISENRYQTALAAISESADAGDADAGEPEGAAAEAAGESDEPEEEDDAVNPVIREVLDRFALTGERTDVGAVPADTEVVLAYFGDESIDIDDARYRLGPAAVTGDSLEGAASRYAVGEGWHTRLIFKPGADGIDGFNELSRKCFDQLPECPTKQVAIEIDNEVVSSPLIQSDNTGAFAPFDRSTVNITGRFTENEAKELAVVLSYGALPIELEAQQSRIVSASLGTDALEAGVIAGAIGLALVSLYLLAYYRLMGLVAISSLALSGAMLWTIIAWLGESQGLALTLAGVTGLIVAIGVSVDSNIVYFEHLKEDVRSGRTIRSATARAFKAAFSTIVKADVASLIAAAVLYLLTVGQVRGFAFYLGLATILDLVATYFFMGPLLNLMARNRGMRHHSGSFGIPVPTEGSPAAGKAAAS